mmetsp:Transcript_24599/g.53261  ORF Transcript_24599/g.53261 Transcript_24599/m.53261 type:complete len:98 (-) Transcript_24599:752-1045(-)
MSLTSCFNTLSAASLSTSAFVSCPMCSKTLSRRRCRASYTLFAGHPGRCLPLRVVVGSLHLSMSGRKVNFEFSDTNAQCRLLSRSVSDVVVTRLSLL